MTLFLINTEQSTSREKKLNECHVKQIVIMIVKLIGENVWTFSLFHPIKI